MKRTAFLILTIASLVLILQCKPRMTGPDVTEDPAQDDPPEYWAEVPDSTKPADSSTLDALSDISPDSSVLTFSSSTPLLDTLAEADVLVLEASDLTPNGLLRKVTGIDRSGGQVVVTTEQASLEDTVQEGHVGLSTTLVSDDIVPASIGPGITLSAAPRKVQPMGLTFDVNHTVISGITVTGEIAFDIDVDFDLDIEEFSLERAAFITTTEYEADLRFEIDLDGTVDEMVEVGSIHFAPIVIPAGPISLVFVPELSINVGVKGDVAVDTETEIYQHATLTAGMEYSGGWNEVDDFSSSFVYQTPTVDAACSLKGFIGPQLSIKLYDIVGPYANAYGFLELDAAMVGTEAWWELYGGLEMGVGVEVEVLGHSVADKGIPDLIQYRRLLVSGTGSTAHNWELQTVDRYSMEANVFNTENSVAVDSTGGIHVAYGFDDDEYSTLDDNQLKYAYFDGYVWTYEVVDNETDQSALPCIAVDSGGNPYIAYCREDTSADLYLAKKTNGLWSIELIDPSPPTQDDFSEPSLKLDSSGTPRVAYRTGYQIRYAEWDGDDWNIEIVFDPGDTQMIRSPSLDLDASGNPHVTFTHSGDLYHAYKVAGSWTAEQLTFAGTNIINQSVSIAVDSDGYPHIGYRDSGQDITYIRKSASGWSDPTQPESVVDDMRFNSGYLFFVLDDADVPHFCWFDFDSDSLLYSVWQGSGWSTGTVDATADVVGKTNFMTVSGTTPYISYYDETNRYLKLARWTGP